MRPHMLLTVLSIATDTNCRERCLHTIVLLSVLLLVPSPALADGLIYRLPPDGTLMELTGESEGEECPVVPKGLEGKLAPESKARLTEKFKLQTTVTVSSVGKITRGGQACRWIELAMHSSDKQAPGDKTNHVLKMLIPDKFLTRGKDPLSHSILTYFNPKEVDKQKLESEKGFNRIQYEIDRFRGVFPERLAKLRQLPRKTVSTPVGTFKDCEVVAGVTEFDRPLLGGGRWAFKHDWQIALHPEAPFGVVEVRCRFEGSEFDEDGVAVRVKGTTTLALSKIGKGAKSVLGVGAGVNRPSSPSRSRFRPPTISR